MAEDQSQQAEETAAGTGAGEGGSEPDYKALWEKSQADLERAKANSRKWEDRSKANADKARAFDASQEKAKTVEERLAALERENAGLRAARDRAALVESVSRATGLELNDPAVWQGRSTEQAAVGLDGALREVDAVRALAEDVVRLVEADVAVVAQAKKLQVRIAGLGNDAVVLRAGRRGVGVGAVGHVRVVDVDVDVVEEVGAHG